MTEAPYDALEARERMLRDMLAELHQSYVRAILPIHKELGEIEAARGPRSIHYGELVQFVQYGIDPNLESLRTFMRQNAELREHIDRVTGISAAMIREHYPFPGDPPRWPTDCTVDTPRRIEG